MKYHATKITKWKESKVLTLRKIEELPTPAMKEAALEEAFAVRRELEEIKGRLDRVGVQRLKKYRGFLNNNNESFLHRFIDCQVECALQVGSRQRRWSEEIISFWKNFRHQASGRSCLKFLAGEGNFGKKKDNNSNNKFNLHVPSNRTLDMYEDPGYYPVPPEEEIEELKNRAATHAQNVKVPWFIIAFDGVFILKKYEWDTFRAIIYTIVNLHNLQVLKFN